MRFLIIVNPEAGKYQRQTLDKALQDELSPPGHTWVLHEARPGEHLGSVVKGHLANHIDVVVAAGGDGTVAGVADALMGTEVPLAIIPLGTGNFVARELGVPQTVQGATALLADEPRSVSIDAMRVEGRVYVLSAGVGISASVVGGTTSKSKKRFGFVAYVLTTVGKLLTMKPRRLTVVVDGRAHVYRAVEVLVSNCGLPTRLLYPRTPDIRMDDGHLDAWVMSTQALFDYPRYLMATIFGRTPSLAARFIPVKASVRIDSPAPLSVQADGDIIGTTPVEIDVLPGALTVLAPAGPSRMPARESVDHNLA